MGETETQKNWNNFYKNPHPPKQHNYFILKLIILLAIAGAVIFYRYSIKEKGIYHSVNINANGIVVEEHGISNQNGVDMNISLDKIDEILNNITKKDIKELYKDIKTIENLDLSNHYNELKEALIKKIQYWIEYKETKTRESLDLFNGIDYIQELAKAFDKASVEYEFTENGMQYKYHLK